MQVPTGEGFNAAVLHFDALEAMSSIEESMTLHAPTVSSTFVNTNEKIVSFSAGVGGADLPSGLQATFENVEARLKTESPSYVQRVEVTGDT